MDTNGHQLGLAAGENRSRAPLPLFGAVLLIIGFAAACQERDRKTILSGEAMGTTWQVTVAAPLSAGGRDQLKSAIADRLEEIEAKMSHWREDSEVSRFNRSPAGEAVPVSEETARVVAFAQEVRAQSGGAFDVTVARIVAAGGFGPDALVPGVDDVLRAGGEHLRVSLDPPSLEAGDPNVAIDLSGVAKGYAVDQAAALLESAGHRDFLIEVGGELRAKGRRPGGDPWMVGIEAPDPAERRIQIRIALTDESIATSGNYRLFREGKKGDLESHLVDPRTGETAGKPFRSVSVIHAEAMTADAWATALFVLGEEKGLATAEELGIAVCFLKLREDGAVEEKMTAGFEARVRD